MKKVNSETQRNISSALQLWQAFEYLNPQKPPEVKREKNLCNWEIPVDSPSDHDMPWVDPEKRDDLDKLFMVREDSTKRFLLYAGVLPGEVYTNAARVILDTPAIHDDEKPSPANAASLVLAIDDEGYVAGLPFVSSTPWALGNLAAASRKGTRFDFRGFFGTDGAEAATVEALKALLVKRTLLPPQADNSRELSTVSSLLTSEQDEAKAEEIRKTYRTITADDVRAMTALLFKNLGWAPSSEAPWVIKTQSVGKKSKKEMDDPLNSFYAEEVETVQRAFLAGDTGAALNQFLASIESPERVDLDAKGDKAPLVDGLHPSKLPLAAWPGSHPLVTAQQFAVNTIHRDLASAGLFSVNGPPGTGKTTMLKDIVATVVQQRADALMAFNHPNDAFSEELKVEDHKYKVWKLDASLCGYGMVVASANNGAVENISLELPGLSAIDEAVKLDYFSEVSDSMGLKRKESRPASPQTWGLISAALGNSTNRNAFASTFWFPNKECKKLPDGTPNPLAQVSLPEWVDNQKASAPSWQDAKARYQSARQRAAAEVKEAADLADTLERLPRSQDTLVQLQAQETELQGELVQLESAASKAKQASDAAVAALVVSTSRLEHAQALAASKAKHEEAVALASAHVTSRPVGDVNALMMEMAEAESEEKASQRNLVNHDRCRPGLLTRWFSRDKVAEWEARHRQLNDLIERAQKKFQDAQKLMHSIEHWDTKLRSLHEQEQKCKSAVNAACHRMENAGFPRITSLSVVAAEHAKCQGNASACRHELQRVTGLFQQRTSTLDELRSTQAQLSGKIATMVKKLEAASLRDSSRKAWHLFALSRDEFHQVSPYQDDGALFNARRELFVAAMELHKAFVVHAWSKLKPTLSVFIDLLQGKLHGWRVQGGVMPLWDAFFVTVPLGSTAFASFPRLFKGVKGNDLAWVLIDEAGQATPQQAIGAIWRSKRVVIVGDPIQLEPVVNIPQELVAPLQAYCDTLPKYVPPDASVQTLADRSNRYGTLMGSKEDGTDIWLGSPLVVHRRCINPMFQIANAIAYENRMVYGTREDASFAATPSAWLDASNDDAQGHWIESQAKRALEGIEKLTDGKVRDEKGKLRIYVITPFRLVGERMRDLLRVRFGRETAQEMCGTVHTFQGKEADFVIFLLGGDPARRGVISSYAGRKPNLVNVAVTRAKKRLYVIGNKEFWCSASDFNDYYKTMERLM
ncbi:AAA domain-containing protein [Acidovorax sp. SUPP2539]|uniref:DEAD/DEAH box helicase n=1 Tax=Acidovorax sp. SUPP2539 TaxID=2920878 RepID=UPI0023DE21AF|nr:AAA domain-containing protein [Acidovorax sp. SUPP2539]GKS88674.1 ATP-binding protein [Acidovorax sp. SUPP2539]